MRIDFKDRVVLVTGAAAGIGAATARAFAHAGARVLLLDLLEEAGEAEAAALRQRGLAARFRPLDVADEADIGVMVAEVTAAWGGVDVVFSNAGIAGTFTIPQLTGEHWRRVLEVNLSASFYLTKAVTPSMIERGGGSIIITSSVAAEHVAYYSGVHYATTKTALKGFVRHAAFELGRHQIRVNAIGPGPMSNRMYAGGRHEAERLEAMAQNQPLQRPVEPEDIAHAAAFLASPLASAITGVYLPVDGGFLTGRNASQRGYFKVHNEEMGDPDVIRAKAQAATPKPLTD
ncbi:MAG: SDR family oxidoreductase [Alphaproteobacteria bacterium]|nr:SDR family oxidoreductase [Alphaproteobacteria bacterium]